jgi:hypothetical protein
MLLAVTRGPRVLTVTMPLTVPKLGTAPCPTKPKKTNYY